MNTLKLTQFALILSSAVFALFSCKKNAPIGEEESIQSHYIQEYVEHPQFTATIVQDNSGELDEQKQSLKLIVGIDETADASSHVVNYARDPKRFLVYANRYKDLSYNRPHPAPNTVGALAEPITKIRCYECSSSGEFVDVSKHLTLSALTHLPYINSGYTDRKEIEPSFAGHSFGPTDYLVSKPILSLTEKDLTLLDYKSWGYLLEIRGIPPYQISKQIELKIIVEENGKTHEFMVM